jgi:hypothetical protein
MPKPPDRTDDEAERKHASGEMEPEETAPSDEETWEWDGNSWKKVD